MGLIIILWGYREGRKKLCNNTIVCLFIMYPPCSVVAKLSTGQLKEAEDQDKGF